MRWGQARVSNALLAHQPWIIAGFVTGCHSMSMVSKTQCSHFSGQGSYYGYTHAGLNFTMKSWPESLVLMSVIMHGPYLKWTHYCVWSDGTTLEQQIFILPLSLPSGAWSIGIIKVALRAGNGTQANKMQRVLQVTWQENRTMPLTLHCA